jgi:hypothetical protein
VYHRPVPLRTWIGITGVVLGGATAGALLARAVLPRPRPSVDPALELAAEQVVAGRGDGTDLMSLADQAYRVARPSCPATLDPDDPSHAGCVGDWLRLRDLVAAKLPPPPVRAPTPQAGLADTGPAADMRGWLESLTPEQRTGLREIIGAKFYDPIVEAAAEGDDEDEVEAVLDLKEEIEEFASDSPLAALRQYKQLKGLLGPKLDELLRLAQQYESST